VSAAARLPGERSGPAEVQELASLLRAAVGAGPLEICARGVSMRPLLRPGDRVRLERRPPRFGQVALVALEDRVVLHRLLAHRAGRWLVRGDARPVSDGWVSDAQILAVATGRRRGRGDPGLEPLDGPWLRRLAGLRAWTRHALRRARRGPVVRPEHPRSPGAGPPACRGASLPPAERRSAAFALSP